jgi:hypothetical protein
MAPPHCPFCEWLDWSRKLPDVARPRRAGAPSAQPGTGTPAAPQAPLDHAELDISWQLQRVRGQLLHRATKTEAPDAALPLPGICVTALRMRQKDQDAVRVAASQWPETGLVFTTWRGRRTSRATSTGALPFAVPGPGSVVSPSTTPGVRAPPCSPRSTFIPRVAMRILRHAQIDVTMNGLHRGVRRQDVAGAQAARQAARGVGRCCTCCCCRHRKGHVPPWGSGL